MPDQAAGVEAVRAKAVELAGLPDMMKGFEHEICPGRHFGYVSYLVRV